LPFPVVIPLHQAVSQTLLTRPPLVSEAASCFLLPFDLHVLGLPPAFNLSHDTVDALAVRGDEGRANLRKAPAR
ncbi:hypothetical protein, partial [Enterobacter hormaechei]|uniref:hypothetical protein n=1 Tax=Enterobacter hormaechei TaxID=158836 RepID=UPI0028768DE2